jgi:hypothetical protein
MNPAETASNPKMAENPHAAHHIDKVVNPIHAQKGSHQEEDDEGPEDVVHWRPHQPSTIANG